MAKKSFKTPTWAREETAVFMRQIVAQLKALNLYEGADEGGLMMIAMSYNAMLDAHDRVAEEGLFDTNRQGVSVPSGPFSVMMQAQTQLIKLLREYGLTSKARASLKRLDEGGEADDDPLTLLAKELQ